MSAGAEQRTSTRKVLRTPATLKAADWPQPLVGRTRDVSEGGVCVSAPANLAVGLVLTLTFEMPSRAQGTRSLFQVKARVAYSVFSASEGFKIGLAFVERPPEAMRLLQGFLVGA